MQPLWAYIAEFEYLLTIQYYYLQNIVIFLINQANNTVWLIDFDFEMFKIGATAIVKIFLMLKANVKLGEVQLQKLIAYGG